MNSFEVVVAGGGSAGLAAALSSARAGARTLLIERYPNLGGTGANALVHTFCGLFHPDTSLGPQWLNPGLPTEIGQRLLERHPGLEPELMGRVFVIRHQPKIFAGLARELCANEPLLTVSSGVALNSVVSNAEGWSLSVADRPIATRTIVDTSGDATVARAFGSEFWQTVAGEKLYRPAYVFALQNLVSPVDDAVRLQVAALLVRSVKEGVLPAAVLGASLRPSPQAGEVFVSVDLDAGGSAWDPLDPACVADVESHGRDLAEALTQHLRAHVPAFAHCPAPVLPLHAGIRESARWRGDYQLTAMDLLASRRFEDEVALAGWPLEMRETAKGPRFRYFDQPQPAGIPARCLRNSALQGIYFAGRCLSADHEALASVRVMGTCLATGQAAGSMAAREALKER